MRQLYLVSYDIRSNSRRARVLRAIKGNAVGGQKSVYECWLDKREFESARSAINTLINTDTDRVFFTRLDPRARVHTLGVATPPGDGQMFYLG